LPQFVRQRPANSTSSLLWSSVETREAGVVRDILRPARHAPARTQAICVMSAGRNAGRDGFFGVRSDRISPGARRIIGRPADRARTRGRCGRDEFCRTAAGKRIVDEFAATDLERELLAHRQRVLAR
jgi:hypothetical protein